MQHELEAITIQKVEVQDATEDPVRLSSLEPRLTAVGCRVCGMVLDEALEVPCPGRSVKAMIEEWGENIGIEE